MSLEHPRNPFDQAVDECTFEGARPSDVLDGIVTDAAEGEEVADLIGVTVRNTVNPRSPREWAQASALLALAVGVKAERIRQRRHGDHPSEQITTTTEDR